MKIITVAYDIIAVPSRTYSYWKKVTALAPDISNKQSQILYLLHLYVVG